MHHILVNCDHINLENIAHIATENTHIWLFLSVKQKSLDLDLVESLLAFDQRIHFIHDDNEHDLSGLDFYLSFYIGKIIEIDPHATIIVVTRNEKNDFFLQHIRQTQACENIIRINQLEELPLIDYIQSSDHDSIPEPIFADDYDLTCERDENPNYPSYSSYPNYNYYSNYPKLGSGRAILAQENESKNYVNHSYLQEEYDHDEDESDDAHHFKTAPVKENKAHHSNKTEKQIISADIKKQIEEDEKIAEVNFAVDEIFNHLIMMLLKNSSEFPNNRNDFEQEILNNYFPTWAKSLDQETQDYISNSVFNKFIQKSFIKYKNNQIIYNVTPESIYENIIVRVQRRRPRTLQGLVDIIQNEADFMRFTQDKITALLNYIENRKILIIENKNIIYPDENSYNEEKDYQQKKEEAFKLSLSAFSSETGPKTKEKLKKQISPYIRHFPDLSEEDLIKYYVENQYLIINNFGIVTYHDDHYQNAHSFYSEAYTFVQDNPYYKSHIELLDALFEYFEEKLSLLSCQVIIHILKSKKCLTIKNNIITYKF